jgi:hypothetical protein
MEEKSTMKKKNAFLRLALVLVVLATVCASLFAGNTTLAMYSATATGTGSATVAKFDVTLNNIGMVSGMTGYNATNLSAIIDLFATVTEWGTVVSPGVDQGDGVDDAEVANAAAGAPAIIAPGTNGGLGGITVANLSDVTIQVKAKVELGSGGTLPITWKNGTSAYTPGTDVVVSASLAPNATANLAALTWEWPFADNSVSGTPGDGEVAAAAPYGVGATTDSPIGIGARTTPVTNTATVTITATQID